MVQQNQTYRVARVVTDQNLSQSSTTQQNITSLVAALKASKTYKFKATVLCIGKANADIDIGLGALSGAVATWGLQSVTPKVSAIGDEIMVSLSDDTLSEIIVEGVFTVSTTAGNLQITAAQTTSQANQLTIKAGSILEVWQVSDTT